MPITATAERGPGLHRAWVWILISVTVAAAVGVMAFPAGRNSEVWVGKRAFGYDPLKWRTGRIQACGPFGGRLVCYYGPFWTVERN
jgi:hypothetical protein